MSNYSVKYNSRVAVLPTVRLLLLREVDFYGNAGPEIRISITQIVSYKDAPHDQNAPQAAVLLELSTGRTVRLAATAAEIDSLLLSCLS